MAQPIKFNNVAIAAPNVFQVSFKDLDSDSSSRNAKGTLLRDRIRAAMRTIHCEWGTLTTSEISTILQNVNSVSFSVYYPDPMSGAWDTRTVYVGDRVTKATYDFDKDMWTGLSFDLIEY